MTEKKKETGREWRRRMMRETEGMTLPGDIIAHLAEDTRVNGPPPKVVEAHYANTPPEGAVFVLCVRAKNSDLDGMEPCEGCPGYGLRCKSLWTPPSEEPDGR